jgi:hypothetical protein
MKTIKLLAVIFIFSTISCNTHNADNPANSSATPGPDTMANFSTTPTAVPDSTLMNSDTTDTAHRRQ